MINNIVKKYLSEGRYDYKDYDTLGKFGPDDSDMDYEKREFKRKELEWELRHEKPEPMYRQVKKQPTLNVIDNDYKGYTLFYDKRNKTMGYRNKNGKEKIFKVDDIQGATDYEVAKYLRSYIDMIK